VAAVRDQVGRDPAFPDPLFVYMGTPEQGSVLTDLWPQVRAIADPEAQLYEAFGLTRGGVAQVLAPGVWLRGVQALLRGHSVGKPVGDVWRMPGYFLIEAGHITWYYRPRDSADHPDWNAVPRRPAASA
jgi:hypothetical protein